MKTLDFERHKHLIGIFCLIILCLLTIGCDMRRLADFWWR